MYYDMESCALPSLKYIFNDEHLLEILRDFLVYFNPNDEFECGPFDKDELPNQLQKWYKNDPELEYQKLFKEECIPKMRLIHHENCIVGKDEEYYYLFDFKGLLLNKSKNDLIPNHKKLNTLEVSFTFHHVNSNNEPNKKFYELYNQVLEKYPALKHISRVEHDLEMCLENIEYDTQITINLTISSFYYLGELYHVSIVKQDNGITLRLTLFNDYVSESDIKYGAFKITVNEDGDISFAYS